MTVQRVRRATVVDAPELVRLRLVMLAAMHVDTGALDAVWRDRAIAVLEARLSDRSAFAGFVIDAGPDLASCALAWLTNDLPSPWSPDGIAASVANVCTDERFRRQGMARAVMVAAQDWLVTTGITTARLSATPDGEPLYRELGWTDPLATAMVLRLNR